MLLGLEEPACGTLELAQRDPFDPYSKWLRTTQLEAGIHCKRGRAGGRCSGREGHAASVMSGVLRSAGLLPFRTEPDFQVLLGHPGGPYFARADHGAWSVIKGEMEAGEEPEEAAAREFEEETGWQAPPRPWIHLGETRLASRKIVVAFAVEQDYDPHALDPGTFVLWGRRFPELDRVEWFGPDEARQRLNPAQAVFVDRLEEHLELNGDRKE